MKYSDAHVLHYFILLVGLIFLLILFYLFRFNLQARIIIDFVICFYYFLWGVFHHKLEDRLTNAVFAEYLSYSAFTFVLVLVAMLL